MRFAKISCKFEELQLSQQFFDDWLILTSDIHVNMPEDFYFQDSIVKVGFLFTDNHVFNGQIGRSLCLFACTTHSAHSLCSLPRGTVTILEYVVMLLLPSRVMKHE